MEKLYVDYAHRGLWGGNIPENSIPAFAAAAANGYGIELDVQLSSDGDVVVFHDYTLKRMCNDDVHLSSLRGAELSWRKLGDTEYTIPLFEDVLNTVKGRVPILIELKGESGDTELCEAVSRILGHYDGKVCVESFNQYLLGWFRKHSPRTARGLLYTDVMKKSTGNRKNDFILTSMISNIIARPDFLAVDEKCLDYFPVRLMMKFHKLTTFVWTVHGMENYTKYRTMRFKSIFEGFLPEGKKEIKKNA
jgi:glycerophosphoryl diester phosphodiesterase